MLATTVHPATTTLLITLLIWLVSVVGAYLVARRKGRNVVLWTALAVFLSWLALLVVALLPARRRPPF